MKRVVLTALVLSLTAALTGLASAAPAPKADVCHHDADTGAFHLINISENAFAKHVEHGDGAPGDAVPGTDSASGDLTVQVNGTGPTDRVLQFDAAYVFVDDCGTELAGFVHWSAGERNFDAEVTALSVSGNQATIWGTVTASGGGSGASPGDTFEFTVTDASPDLVFWTWLTGPNFTGPFTVITGDVTVFDAA